MKTMTSHDEAVVRAVDRVVGQCSNSLKGHIPPVQSAALAQLIVMWIEGWHPVSERQALLEDWFHFVRALSGLYDDNAAPPPLH
jgi:hypothetical protein